MFNLVYVWGVLGGVQGGGCRAVFRAAVRSRGWRTREGRSTSSGRSSGSHKKSAKTRQLSSRSCWRARCRRSAPPRALPARPARAPCPRALPARPARTPCPRPVVTHRWLRAAGCPAGRLGSEPRAPVDLPHVLREVCVWGVCVWGRSRRAAGALQAQANGAGVQRLGEVHRA